MGPSTSTRSPVRRNDVLDSLALDAGDHSHSLLVRVSGEFFSIPVDDVREIVEIPKAQVLSMHGHAHDRRPRAQVHSRHYAGRCVRLAATAAWLRCCGSNLFQECDDARDRSGHVKRFRL